MTRQSKLTQFNTRIPEDLMETVNQHPDANQDIAARALRKEIGLNGKTELDLRIEQKERRINLVKEEIAELEEELANHVGDLEELKQRREELKAPEEKYEEELSSILSKVEDGDIKRLVPKTGQVRDLADEFGEDPVDVHEDLKMLAAEQDRRIFNTQFMPPREAEQVNITDKELVADAFSESDQE